MDQTRGHLYYCLPQSPFPVEQVVFVSDSRYALLPASSGWKYSNDRAMLLLFVYPCRQYDRILRYPYRTRTYAKTLQKSV